MKRGNRSSLIFVSIILFVLTISCVSCVAAYNGFGYGYGYDKITLAEIVENVWVNIALVFLLVFSVCLFVLKDVFKRSYGAAVIIAGVIAAISSFGFIAYYGPIISKVGPWVLVLFIAIIVLSLWRLFKGIASLIWILLAIALVWLLWARRQLCGAGAFFPAGVCTVLDFLAIIIVIIGFFTLIWKIFERMKKAPVPEKKWIWKEEKWKPGRVPSGKELEAREKYEEAQTQKDMAWIRKKYARLMKSAEAKGKPELLPLLKERCDREIKSIEETSRAERAKRREEFDKKLARWRKESVEKKKIEKTYTELQTRLNALKEKIERAEAVRQKFINKFGPKEGVLKEDTWITRTLTKENYNAAADLERRMKKIEAILKKYY